MKKKIKKLGIALGILLIVLFLIGGSISIYEQIIKDRQQTLVGRYQIFFGPITAKQSFLVDTVTGLTWQEVEDPNTDRPWFAAVSIEDLARCPSEKIDFWTKFDAAMKARNPNYEADLTRQLKANKYEVERYEIKE